MPDTISEILLNDTELAILVLGELFYEESPLAANSLCVRVCMKAQLPLDSDNTTIKEVVSMLIVSELVNQRNDHLTLSESGEDYYERWLSNQKAQLSSAAGVTTPSSNFGINFICILTAIFSFACAVTALALVVFDHINHTDSFGLIMGLMGVTCFTFIIALALTE